MATIKAYLAAGIEGIYFDIFPAVPLYANSVFSLNYHLILVVKYRRRVIDDIISDRAKRIFEYICPKYNITTSHKTVVFDKNIYYYLR